MLKKNFISLFLSLILVAISQPAHSQSQPAERQFFQIKVYHFDNISQQERTDQFLNTAYLPALHRAGIKQVGVFKPVEQDTAALRTYVLIPFSSLDKFEALAATLQNDSQFSSDGQEYLEATYDHPPYNRIKSILLKSFKDAPTLMESTLPAPKTKRIYELRSYESPTEALNINKVDMFNAGGEIDIFNRLDFNSIFYGNVLVGDAMPNLMYMTSFKDMASRDKHWDQFGSDAQWEQLSSMEKYQNNVSHADIHLLHATSYSDI
ncbi:NIPSNAP family protein [Fodinibius salsisoli]|uniref:NIPSNAP family protein n=1 Tax=Fodinibius salsisoli TaxID=2820877 RepID=A0ABT3PJ52_9BACT|nr:NIPSNAP family protein [Fodinibius salsisoli]MCW9705964.1 NIPSNAP family protein [Fodinibius salsisoli]